MGLYGTIEKRYTVTYYLDITGRDVSPDYVFRSIPTDLTRYITGKIPEIKEMTLEGKGYFGQTRAKCMEEQEAYHKHDKLYELQNVFFIWRIYLQNPVQYYFFSTILPTKIPYPNFAFLIKK